MIKRFCAFVSLLLFATPCLSSAHAQTAQELRDEVNKGTVSIISGGVNGTYIRIASDLVSVLDNGDLRVLAIVGKGSVQNIEDILYLRGIDVGIVQSDVLAFSRMQNQHPNLAHRINYITKLYNEEFHFLVGRDIGTIEDLSGKTVNIGVKGSGTSMSASVVLEALGVDVETTFYDQDLALEKLKAGEIDGLVYVAGKPTRLFEPVVPQDGLHFLPIPATDTLLETYLPSRLTHEDYPEMVPPGQEVETLAVGAIMAVYNWPEDHARYAKVAHFIDRFFSSFAEFQKPPRHAKWHEVALTAEIPGWQRFKPAEDWLRNAVVAEMGQNEDLKESFGAFLEDQAPDLADQALSDKEKAQLFEQFLKWQATYQEQN